MEYSSEFIIFWSELSVQKYLATSAIMLSSTLPFKHSFIQLILHTVANNAAFPNQHFL